MLSSGNGPRCLDLTAVDGEITDRFGDDSCLHRERPSKQRCTDPLLSLPVPISEVWYWSILIQFFSFPLWLLQISFKIQKTEIQVEFAPRYAPKSKQLDSTEYWYIEQKTDTFSKPSNGQQGFRKRSHSWYTAAFLRPPFFAHVAPDKLTERRVTVGDI